MQISSDKRQSKRRSINLTIREEVLKEAKSLKLNTSQAAEAGIEKAIKQAQSKAWLEENHSAIKAYNERIEKQGTFIKRYWGET